VGERFAGSGGAVVTADAVAANGCMVEYGVSPVGCVMAIITCVTAGDMQPVLAPRDGAIMAAKAATDDINVIDACCWRPSGAVMAIFADIGRADVLQIFSTGDGAVVAVDAEAQHIAVSNATGRGPGQCAVAIQVLVVEMWVSDFPVAVEPL